jgi:hypothetical protein
MVDQPKAKNSSARVLMWLFEIFAAIILLVDAAARPLYKPLLNWFANLTIIHRFEAWVATLPRFLILVFFAVPFIVAEPLKVFAVYLIAIGMVVSGVVLMAVAYLVSFLVVERIYHAGRDKLLTYAWFKWGMDRVVFVRDLLLSVRDAALLRVRAWMGFRSPE